MERQSMFANLSRLTTSGALVACGLAACATTTSLITKTELWADASYQFSERPPGLDKSIEGTVRVLGDTVMVEAQPGPCRYDSQLSAGGRPFTFRCDDVTLFVERSKESVTAKYQATKIVIEYRTTCISYVTNSSGQRVCAQQQTDPVERKVPVSGQLRLTLVGNPK